jgi:hypothetical protein
VVIANSKLFILDSSSRNDVVISALNVIAVFVSHGVPLTQQD